MDKLRYGDIADDLDSVRILYVVEKKDNHNVMNKINVCNSTTGEAKKYFDYYVKKISTQLVYENGFLEREATIKSIMIVFLQKD